MDDSERSYGYSQDIFHGRRERGEASGDTGDLVGGLHGEAAERSYEYDRREEGMGGDLQDGDLPPELAAVHVAQTRHRKVRDELNPDELAIEDGAGSADEDDSGDGEPAA